MTRCPHCGGRLFSEQPFDPITGLGPDEQTCLLCGRQPGELAVTRERTACATAGCLRQALPGKTRCHWCEGVAARRKA